MDNKADNAEFKQLIDEMTDENGVAVYNFKHFMAPDGSGFEYNPRLISEIVTFRANTIEFGQVKVNSVEKQFEKTRWSIDSSHFSITPGTPSQTAALEGAIGQFRSNSYATIPTTWMTCQRSIRS